MFALMGEYYGNANYRSAIRKGWSREDLLLTKELLDRVNALGYCISNVHKMTEIEDSRFLPIVFDTLHRYTADSFRAGLLQTVCFRSYREAVGELLKLYDEPNMQDLRWNISAALFRIRDRKMIPALLKVVRREDYGKEPDMILEILLKYKVEAAQDRAKDLIDKDPFWENLFLRYASSFKGPEVAGLVRSRTEAADPYTRQLAKKAMAKMETAVGKAE